jgi:iron complex transport system substrate-binding protein
VSSGYPSRIVCLSAEAVDVLYRLGVGDRIVGITGFASEPAEARAKPRISGFSTVNYDKIDALQPDLIITFSDVQAEAARELVRRGYTVLATNQRTLSEVFQTILLLGRGVERESEAQALVANMRGEIFGSVAAAGSPGRFALPDRPKVYFEEWDEPLISGIHWVSELIEAAGGRDAFEDLRNKRRAMDRVVESDEVIRRQPDIIVASWCGKKADLAAIAQRPGWDAIPAVRNGHVHEIDSNDILQPGPALLKGLRRLRGIISQVTSRHV